MISMGGLWFRQVHLDCHTSAECEGVDVLTDGRTVERVYLAPENEPLDFEVVDGYTRIALPPVEAHAVVALE
jgi:hypothetical protein